MTSTNKAAKAASRKPPPGALKAYVASLTGTSLEYYDFAIYSVASALVFPKIFFPSNDEFVGLLLSFSAFAVGYLARPIGGIIFGRLGDKVGRKYVLVFTLVLIGVATILIGALPDYSVIGIWAPIILVLLRLGQGIGVGGEWGGAVLLSSEFGDPKKRGFWSSAAQIGPPAGNLMANGVLAVLAASLSTEAFLSWGWRVAFLASALLVVFGLIIRLKLEETPVFKAIAAHGDQPKAPIKEVFTKQPRALISAALSRVCPDVLYALFTVFVAVYATKELGMTTGDVLAAILIGSAFQLFLIPAAGALTDRFNRRMVYGIAAAATAAWIPVFFLIIQGRSELMLIIGVVVGLALHAFMYGPQAAYITEQFPARLRYAGSSLAYTLAGVIGGAVAPLIFTALYAASGSWYLIAGYLLLASIVTIVGLALGRNPQPEEDLRLLHNDGAQESHA
ncbi:MFS transporter [Pseudarthrobacter psychrotolerans]|uniref:Putative proline/betaine transporter n=1 Tax=Pseudarthrobacter psychrotolerans TaxID=2697569 RepID=A0A6P1NJU8_9MICC|nr:MFS transporter [Pseudarthrobacter psychrotolerans]QHK20915.1 MFS transporter [Pseudarthrobacter psychrotolerans]